MKKIYTLVSAVLLSASLWAQAPQKMNYQAVIRGTNNNLVVNQKVGIRISILQNKEDGKSVYTETHIPKTNANGLVTVILGGGNLVSGDFTKIDWSKGPYFVKTETDVLGGTNYDLSTVNELMSVPYALYAANSPAGAKGDVGATGPQGPQGSKGDTGIQGPAGKDGLDGKEGSQGFKGDKGEQGIQGPAGKDGLNGVDGKDGAQGPQGLKGDQGIQGPKGETGAQGPQGLKGDTGLTGDKGDKGDTGLTGVQGLKGDAGAQGLKGDQGIQGPKGETGAQGPQGLKGDTGLTGDKGDTGLTGVQGLKGDTGSQGLKGDQGIQGSKGETGAQGPQGLKGDTGLTGDKGDKGDTGLTGVQGLKGDTGAQGLKGDQGIQGPKGETGAQGPQGLKGDTGLTGDKGDKGDTGLTGVQGLKGDTGSQGLKGDQGIQGPKGETGAQGPLGLKGDTGLQGPQGSAGTNGSNGQNTLVTTTTESAGANCTTGGVKLDYGLDANNNGTLDVGEINATLTKYVCNGFVSTGNASGNTPYWDGATWVLNSSNIFNNGGNVGIGTSTPSVKLEVNGRLKTNGINELSDKRYKKNIEVLTEALAKVEKLRGVSYDWKTEEFPNKNFEAKHQIGLIAQELELVFPELVNTDVEGYKSVDYSKLVAVLIEAVKEQQKEITDLQSDITKQETEMKQVKASINDIYLLIDVLSPKVSNK